VEGISGECKKLDLTLHVREKNRADHGTCGKVMVAVVPVLMQRMKLDEELGPVNVMASQKFILPQDEMTSFKTSIGIMMDQTRKFARLKMQADASPDWTFYNEDTESNQE
jgi:hypothetical protein